MTETQSNAGASSMMTSSVMKKPEKTTNSVRGNSTKTKQQAVEPQEKKAPRPKHYDDKCILRIKDLCHGYRRSSFPCSGEITEKLALELQARLPKNKKITESTYDEVLNIFDLLY